MKDLLKREPYYGTIAWSENDKGEYDARDIISMMLCFNVALFPNDHEDHPIAAYEKKSAPKMFEDRISQERMQPILAGLLRFHDIVAKQGRDYTIGFRIPRVVHSRSSINANVGSTGFTSQVKADFRLMHFTRR